MKYVGIILCLLHVNCFAQIKILNIDLIHSDSSVLYVGVDNHLQVQGIDFAKQYYFSQTLGEILRNPYKRIDEFYLRVNKGNILDTIFIYNEKKKILYKQVFRTELIGNPVAMMDSIPQGFISKNQLMNAKKLEAVIVPHCLLKNPYTVLSFNVEFDCKKCEMQILQNTGQFISSAFFKMIPYLTFGDKVTFEEIKLTCPDCLSRKIPAITYTIE